MIGRHMTKRSRRTHRAWQRSVGAATAAVLALGAMVMTETDTAEASDEPIEPQTIWSLTFDEDVEGMDPNACDTGIADPRYHCWRVSGEPEREIVVDPYETDNQVLKITRGERTHDGIESPAGVMENGKSYNFSMRVLLDPNGTGFQKTRARFVDKPNYSWIGDTPVSADSWTTVTGTWKPTTDTSSVYIETQDDNLSSFSFFVDDIVVTERGAARVTVTDDDAAFVPGEEIVVSGADFPGAVEITFEQDDEKVAFQTQTVSTDGLGWFSDRTIELPANVDPRLPLELVATSRKTDPATVVRTRIDLVTPTLTADPTSVVREESVTLTGQGFVADSVVEITAPRATKVTAHTDAHGSFTTTWTAPALPADGVQITATSAGYPVVSATTTVDVTATGDPELPGPEIAVVDDGDFVPGDVLTVFGAGFTPNQAGTITMTANGYFPPVPFETDGKGQFIRDDVTIPNYWAPGSVTVQATQSRSGDRAETTFTLASPALSLSNAVKAGTVTITGSGFIANETLQYQVVIGTTTQWFSIRSDAEGRFTATAPVPYDAVSVSATAEQWGRTATAGPITVIESSDPLLVPAETNVHRGEGKTVSVTGYRFPKGASVIVTAVEGVNAVTQTIDGNGKFTVAVPIPKGTQLGALTITAKTPDGSVTATATVSVIPDKAPDASTITAPYLVQSGTSFLLTGTSFTPNKPVTVQYFVGTFSKEDVANVQPVGGTTVTADTVGHFTESIAIPHLGNTSTVTISATQGEEHRAITTVTVTSSTVGTITIEGDGTYTPGDDVAVSWTGLVPGHVLVTMKDGDGVVVSEGIIVVRDAYGQGKVSIGVDTLTGVGEYTIYVSAVQGAAKTADPPTSITVKNDFGDYTAELSNAKNLVALRDDGDFRGIDAPWGDLVTLIASNEFSAIQDDNYATQGNADRAEAALKAARKAVAEALLKAAVGSAEKALESYGKAADANAALAEAVAGSARALLESFVATSEDGLKQATATKEVELDIAAYDFENITVAQQPGIPSGVWSDFTIVPDTRDTSENALQIDRVNDWDGLEFSGDQFQAGDVCTFQADVGLPGDAYVIKNPFVTSPEIHFQAKRTGEADPNKAHEWIGYANPDAGEWKTFSNKWTVPEGGVDHIRLVASHDIVPDHVGDTNPESLKEEQDNTKNPWFTFYVDNVSISCIRFVAAEGQTDANTLLDLEAQLQDAIKRLTLALAHFEAGQVLWAPAPGNEPGWVEGDGLYTDDSLARWIGGNLYIRGNSSELEGRTFVANDLSLDKEKAYGWRGFNFGTVSIGSQIALSGDKPALLVCDDMGVYNGSSANINGGVVGIVGDWNGSIYGTWTDKAHEYCKGDDLTEMSEGIKSLSMSLAERPTDGSCDCTEDGEAQAKASEAVVEEGGKLVLTAGDPNVDGLYVFEIPGSELARAKSIVIEGLQGGQSSRAEGGRIDSMKPAVINVIKNEGPSWVPLDWTVESIYLRDDTGYDQLYVGDKFWHPDLGKVSGALLWNFPDAKDSRAGYKMKDGRWTNDSAGWDGYSVTIGDDFNTANFTPAVTIRTNGLGVNFLGSILIPHGSLTTESVSLNGRLYVGGDYLMDDKLEKRKDDPLYGGGYYDGNWSQADLLGHSEGHNYPWWFDPFTAAPSNRIRITKAVAEGAVEELGDAVGTEQEMFAKGRLRCMHVEDAAERQLTPQSDGWWSDELKTDRYLLTVDAIWWLKVGDSDGISIANLPQGTLCGLSEDLGLFTATSATLTSGTYGRLPRGSVEGAAGCDCDDDDTPDAPIFVPVSVPMGLAWALPDVTFDEASHLVTVTAQGPTASLLLTTETIAPAGADYPTATITNSLTPLGQAEITKVVKGTDPAVITAGDDAPEFEFTWSTSLDGYVYAPVGQGETVSSHLVPGTSTGTRKVAAGGTATPQYCPDANALPNWWSKNKQNSAWWTDDGTPVCLGLWFPEGANLTWAEVEEQHQIDGIWYDVHQVEYEGGQTVPIPEKDGTATTTVTNTLVKAPLRFAVKKLIDGTGKGRVPADTEFTIVYKACPPDGSTCDENTLDVLADGQPVYSPPYDDGTRITVLSEGALPEVTDVTWGSPKFSQTELELDEDAEVPVITVTNTAHGPASFNLSKAVPPENVGTAWKMNFDLIYTVYDDGYPIVGGTRTEVASERRTHTVSSGTDLTSGTVTKVKDHTLKVGDIIVISEDGFDPGFDWDKNGYTVEVRNAKGVPLSKCSDRGFAEGEKCGAREFRITEKNINTLSVTVVNRLVGPPDMPMTGGPAAAWIAMISGLALAGLWTLTRAQLVRRRPTVGGGAIR